MPTEKPITHICLLVVSVSILLIKNANDLPAFVQKREGKRNAGIVSRLGEERRGETSPRVSRLKRQNHHKELYLKGKMRQREREPLR